MPAYERTLIINGTPQVVTGPDDTEALLYILRSQAGQHGPQFGCGLAQCGACTVLVNGTITRSCSMPIKNVAAQAAVTTLDGLGTEQQPHPLQRAFIDQQAAQCAFCTNGMIMGALGWLRQRAAAGIHTVPTDDEVKQFLSGQSGAPSFVYLCRCGAHLRIMRAIQQAAQEML